MRIVVDVTPLSLARTGIGNYVRGMVAGLSEAGPEHEIVAFAPTGPRGARNVATAFDGLTVGKRITTIEGLDPEGRHPVQLAWIAEQVPQCGYCQSGQIMQAASLLAKNPHPTDQQIVDGMSGNLCRCATYIRIKRAIKRAAQEV